MTAAILLAAASAYARPGYGKLAGIVVDPTGTPQMGATVWVVAESAGSATTLELLTNQRGQFSTERLLPAGFYTVRVTLAGFLPAMERHVHISSNLTTLLKVQLDSIFASLDRLRRHPQPPVDPDEWKWVLRTSAATRPVLQWVDGEVVSDGELPAGEAARQRRPRARLELTNGARRPGSVSNLADAPATAFAYDQKLGRQNRLLLAGQMSYERSAAAGIAITWLPAGSLAAGPETTLVLRQSKLGPAGPTFRGLRMEHSSGFALGDHFTLHYGAEYVLAGLGPATSWLRPRGELDARLSPNWRAAVLVASRPTDELRSNELQSVLAELDTFPALLWRNGRPVLEGGWHEELAFERRLGPHASLAGAAFRDRAQHLAVFGRGPAPNPEFFQDFFSNGFLYDGGASSSWGTRMAYRQKLREDLDLTAVYAWAGALALEDPTAAVDLRDVLRTRYRHSLAARVSGRLPHLGTRMAASYKWLSAPVVSRQDIFGETTYQLDSYLNLSIRQPLPGFLMSGKWEALADIRNLLAQGYVPVSSRDGQILLVPAFRSFRGGVSFQF